MASVSNRILLYYPSVSSTVRMNDEQIKGVIRQAFIAVEKGFFQSLDDALAEKWELQLQLPEVGISTNGQPYIVIDVVQEAFFTDVAKSRLVANFTN